MLTYDICSECSAQLQEGPGRPRRTCGPVCATARNTRQKRDARERTKRHAEEAEHLAELGRFLRGEIL